MRPILFALVFALIPACGGDDGGGGTTDANTTVDAKIFMDAPAAMITISGVVTERTAQGSTPEEGVLVAAYRSTDENTPVAMAMSAADGTYSLTVETGGQALDGYLKGTKTGLLDTYLYPPAPLGADFNMASVNMLTPNTFGTLDLLANSPAIQQDGMGFIALIVTDGSTPVAGATVSSSPASETYRYNSGGFPAKAATATDTDGVAYMFNVPPGQVTVAAMKTGSTFSSHGLKAWPDSITTTLIVP